MHFLIYLLQLNGLHLDRLNHVILELLPFPKARIVHKIRMKIEHSMALYQILLDESILSGGMKY